MPLKANPKGWVQAGKARLAEKEARSERRKTAVKAEWEVRRERRE